MNISDGEFEKLLGEAIDAIPPPFSDHLQNVAFILEGDPGTEQKHKLNLYPNETLFGLYEGIPLPQRGGSLKVLPDKITIFKNPLLAASQDLDDLKDKIELNKKVQILVIPTGEKLYDEWENDEWNKLSLLLNEDEE